jgi:hypothetical protein
MELRRHKAIMRKLQRKEQSKLNKNWVVQNRQMGPGMVVHTYKPSIQEAEARGLLSFRSAWATQQDPV